MFKIINDKIIQRLNDGAFIPRVADNSDYKSFLDWEREGGIAQPADVLTPPESSTIDKALALLLKHTNVSAEDQKLKDDLLANLGK